MNRLAAVIRLLPDRAFLNHLQVPEARQAAVYRKALSDDELVEYAGFASAAPAPPAPKPPKATADEETIGRVFALICDPEVDGAGKSDIARVLGIEPAVAGAAVETLLAAGKVTKRGAGRATEYVRADAQSE